jgi:SAM-dependent methyltransferase
MEQGRLLDVGCFDGGFLSLVGEGFERFGLEINPEAAERARAKNIEILGADFTGLEKLSEAFDAIIAMDVIEHVENPKALLESMANALRGGGLLMVSTGNTESWTWRMMGSRYWYCTVSEHISFINPSWCWHVAPAAGLEIVGIERFAHQGDASLSQRIAELGKNLFCHLFPGTAAWLRMKGYGGVDTSIDKSTASTPPMWLSAPDHFIVLFRKL